jgi:hypothetical protein
VSTDPQFAAKLRDIVRLYVDPPAHAIAARVKRLEQLVLNWPRAGRSEGKSLHRREQGRDGPPRRPIPIPPVQAAAAPIGRTKPSAL